MPEAFSFQHSDRPILGSGDDTLDRATFARTLARAITTWKANESLCIGLHGDWGAGKTSLANFVTEALIEVNDRQKVVVFNPWVFMNRASLSQSFFEEVGLVLGAESRSERVEIAKAWKRYGERLQHSAKLVRHLAKPTKVFFACAALAVGVSVGFVNPSFWLLSFVLAVLGTALGWFSELSIIIADLIAGEEKNEPALHQLKKTLQVKLAAQDTTILIVIDDLDRLYPKDLTQMVQLIASNSDLPNVTYLLLGDKTVMADALSAELKINGHVYLEKVIQISLTVPSDSSGEVLKLLEQGLDRLLFPTGVSINFDYNRWPEVLRLCLAPYMVNLRAAKRFLNTLGFHHELLNASGELEVDAVDFLALEGLRQFEPDFLKAISKNKHFLTARSTYERPNQAEASMKMASLIGEEATAEQKLQREAILKLLFPAVERVQNPSQQRFGRDDWGGKSRVASAEHFDRYFSFGISKTDVSNADIAAISRSTDAAEVTTHLERWRSRGTLETGLERLWERTETITPEAARAVSIGLLNIGDYLTSESPQMFSLGTMGKADSIVFSLLKREAISGNPVSFLMQVLEASNGVSLASHLIPMVTNLEQTPELASFFASEDIKAELRNWLAVRIAARANQPGFLEVGDLKRVLHLWRAWGNEQDEQARIIELCENTVNALRFLKAMLQVSHTSSRNKRGETKRTRIKLSDLDEYGDREQMKTMLLDSELPRAELIGFEDALAKFAKAVARHERGLPESDSPFDRDEE